MEHQRTKTIDFFNHDIAHYIDCQLLQMRDVTNTIGFPLSSSMCFGLSGGLDFSAQIETHFSVPCLLMLGRDNNNFERFAQRLSIPYEKRIITQADDFAAVVKTATEQGSVVTALADRFYLNYLNNHCAQADPDYKPKHFCQHVIGMMAYDEDADEYIIADMFSNEWERASSEEVQQARLSQWEAHPPNGECYVIDLSVQDPHAVDWNHLVASSIVDNCNKMLADEGGVAAMRSTAKQLTVFGTVDMKKYERALGFQFRILHGFLHEFEKTQSFYRWVYRDFLQQAADQLGCEFARPFVDRFDAAGTLWVEMSNLLASGDVAQIISELPLKLEAAAKCEEACLTDLLTAASATTKEGHLD